MSYSNQANRRDDHEIDRAASAYAHRHNVSYSEALSRVAGSIADFVVPARSAAAAPSSDVDLDRQAQTHARDHGVSYSEALDVVVGRGANRANFGEASFGGAAAAMESALIEIFSAGTHVADQGLNITFTRSMLEATAAAYNPFLREAPLVIGHPETDAPARGWVKSLEVTSGNKLAMRVRQVEPEFAEDVAAGRFKKRSASFYMPDDFRNPAPGVWYLRHVGWLGARQPAVSGMADLAFGEASGLVTFSM